MREINRYNYPLWFTDYRDGALSDEQTAMLMQFLRKNADMEAEFHAWEELHIPVENPALQFMDKKALKFRDDASWEINSENYENYLIGSIEGVLNDREEMALRHFLQANPMVQAEAELYEKTILQPDQKLVYFNKEGLKHREMATWLLQIAALAAAASLLLLVYLSPNKTTSDKKTVLRKQPNPIEHHSSITADNKQVVTNPASQHPGKQHHIIVIPHSVTANEQTAKAKSENTATLPMPMIMLSALPMQRETAVVERKMDNKLFSTPASREHTTEENGDANKEYLSLGQVIQKFFTTNRKNNGNSKQQEIAGMLDMGMQGLGKAIGQDVALDTRFDEQGRLTAFAFNAGNFSVEKNVHNRK
ncbi:MAG: hypothetical protein ACE5DN_07730 [Flavobacteriales bacterium]